MTVRFVEGPESAGVAAKDLEQSLLLTLHILSLPRTPQAAVERHATQSPFWYRSMYMLAIVAEELGKQAADRKEWTTRNIGSTLAITLEEQLASLLRFQKLPRWLRAWRWAFLLNKLELARFLETVEPEILVLVAGMFADGGGPLTLPRDASDREDLRVRPSHHVVVGKIRAAADAKAEADSIEAASFLVGYAVRYLDMTPRGNYNLACYCSSGATRVSQAKRPQWIAAAQEYLFDGLAGLDVGMDAWARVDTDLLELRRTDASGFDDLLQRAAAVRTARFAVSGSREAAKPPHRARKT